MFTYTCKHASAQVKGKSETCRPIVTLCQHEFHKHHYVPILRRGQNCFGADRYYQKQLASAREELPSDVRIAIEKDLHRTFPPHVKP